MGGRVRDRGEIEGRKRDGERGRVGRREGGRQGGREEGKGGRKRGEEGRRRGKQGGMYYLKSQIRGFRR